MSSVTAARIVADMSAAMKSRNSLRTEVLRGLKSEIKYWEIEAKKPAEEADVHKVLRFAQKKRRDAIDLYKQGGRQELAQKEETELAIIGEYLPAEMTDADIAGFVTEAIAETGAASAGDLGKVMKAAMTKVAGRADGNRVRQAVADALGRLASGS
jgi:hypothetical protein